MSIWWIFIIVLMAAIFVFVIKYSSQSESKLEERNAALDRKNKLSASLDLKTRVKNGILGLDLPREKVIYLIDTETGFIVKEFDFKEIESFALMLDEEILYSSPSDESAFAATAPSAKGVTSAYLAKTSMLRGDVGALDLKIIFRHSNNPYYLFNFYTKRLGAKSALETAIHSIEEWADRLIEIMHK